MLVSCCHAHRCVVCDAIANFRGQAFHGGGYNYRLCPSNNPAGLTEQCFQSHHLKFAGESMLRWGGVDGKRKLYNATIVSDGTIPQGSTWVFLAWA